MAEVKMIRTTHDKLTEELIPIEDGSYIVVLDTKELYLDKGENRKRLSFARSTSYDMIEDYAFSAGTAYSKGQKIYYNGHWYERIADGTPSSFVESEWTQVSSTEATTALDNNIDIGNNFNLANNAISIGENNFVVGTGCGEDVLIGSNNFIGFPGCHYNVLVGTGNEITGISGGGVSRNYLFGLDNKIENASGSSDNFILGSNNALKNNVITKSAIFGDSITIDTNSGVNYLLAEGASHNIGVFQHAHIEGQQHTISSSSPSYPNTFSHIEGKSHTLGGTNNQGTHIEGLTNSIAGTGNIASHIEGQTNTTSSEASGSNSLHIEGTGNSLTGGGSTALSITGESNTVVGGGAHALHIEGYNNTVAANGSNGCHIEGYGHTINGSGGYGAHIEGNAHTIEGTLQSGMHIEGANNAQPSSAPCCHIEGQNNTVYGGYASHCGGYQNQIGSYNSSTDDYTGSNASFVTCFGMGNIASESYETVIGLWNEPYKDAGMLFLIGNGSSAARSNIFEVSHNSVNVNGELDYYGHEFTAPINKLISWFSPNLERTLLTTAAVDPATGKFIKAVEPIVCSSLTDLNSYFTNNNIDWVDIEGDNSKTIHFYNPSTAIYFSYYRTSNASQFYTDNFTFVKGSVNLKNVCSISSSVAYQQEHPRPLEKIVLSGTNFNGISIYSKASGEQGAGEPLETIQFMTSGSYFDNITADTLANSEWWFWTTPANGEIPTSPEWEASTLNLNNIMEHDYAKALQTQYNMNWIASTAEKVVTYRVNSIVIYNNCIYRCIVQNADTEWTPAHWEQIGITKAAFDALEARVAALEG